MGNIKKSSTKLIMFILFFIGLVGFIVTAGIYYNEKYIKNSRIETVEDLSENGTLLGFIIMIVIFDIVLGLMIIAEEGKIAKDFRKMSRIFTKCTVDNEMLIPGYVKKNKKKFVYWKKDILGIYRACGSASFMCNRCGRVYVYDGKADNLTECKKDILSDQSAYIIFFVVGCIIAAFVIFAAIRAMMGGIFFTKTVCVAIGAIILCIIFTGLLSREK